jgi:hypothetical protein
MFYLGTDLGSGWSPVQEILPVVERIHNFVITCEQEQAIKPNVFSEQVSMYKIVENGFVYVSNVTALQQRNYTCNE